MQDNHDASKEEMLFLLLAKENQYYLAILDLVREEAEEYKNQENMQRILPLVKKRQILFSCIHEIEKALTPLKEHWKETPNLEDPYTEKVRAQLLENDQILSQILDLDQDNQQSMERYLSTRQKSP